MPGPEGTKLGIFQMQKQVQRGEVICLKSHCSLEGERAKLGTLMFRLPLLGSLHLEALIPRRVFLDRSGLEWDSMSPFTAPTPASIILPCEWNTVCLLEYVLITPLASPRNLLVVKLLRWGYLTPFQNLGN